MDNEAAPLVILGDHGSTLCVDLSVSDMQAILSAMKQFDPTGFVPRLKQEFESFVSEVESTLAEIYDGDWDRNKDGVKELNQAFGINLERWKNRSEREKYKTALKAEALTPLLIQEVKYLERSNAGANELFGMCASLLNGEKPRKPHTDDELKLIQDTKEKLLALGVGPDFRPSFDKWFLPGEAQDIVRWAKLSDAEMDSMFAKDAKQVVEWVATSAS